jgi:cytochrome P450
VVTKFVGSIGTSLVDWFPELDKLPRVLQPWRRHWEELGDWNEQIYRSWWIPAREKVENGTAPPSWVRDVLLHPDTKFTGNDQEAMYVALQLVEAGSDTTREVLNIFAMAALCYPDKYQKAREEVDNYCDNITNFRLPGIDDLEKMPYICAMIKELLRWRPIFPFTPDHVLTSDMEFEGYNFPAGVGFVINEIPVCNECEDPEVFKPERWLDGHETDPAHGLWQFGGGRRICVGYRLAFRGLFINVARLVFCYDYKAVSWMREIARIKADTCQTGPYNSKFLNHHRTDEPFPVKIVARSEQHINLILEEGARLEVLEDAKHEI